VIVDAQEEQEQAATPDANPDDGDEDALPPEMESNAEMALMSMILMIGHVPVVQLSASSSGTEGGLGTLPGSESEWPPVIDTSPPPETPEPTAWLLALIGGVCAASGGWLRSWNGSKPLAA
jgi:hypothetical protein